MLGRSIIVPITNPESADGLVRLAALLASSDDGQVVPVSVVTSTRSPQRLEDAHNLVIHAEKVARHAGAHSQGLVASDPRVAEGVLDAITERDGSLVVMGWTGHSTRSTVFGELIDSVAGRSPVPLAVARLLHDTPDHLIAAVTEDDLTPRGMSGVHLVADITRRLADGWDIPVRVLRSGRGESLLPDDLALLSDRVHHDPRRLDKAVGAAATGDELVVVGVPPTESGLRTATTHVAWAAPHSSLLVVLDTGPAADQPAVTAVRGAGRAAPEPSAEPARPHNVRVTVRLARPDKGAPERLQELLTDIGEPEGVDADGVTIEVQLEVSAADGGAALGKVMTVLHEVPWLAGSAIRYDLV